MNRSMLLGLVCSAFFACNNKNEVSTTLDSALVQQENATINFHLTDSIEFIYFPQALNQRLYKQTMINDKELVNTLVNNLAQPTVTANECAHQIKLYLFNNGAVYKTVYASLKDSCNYLAYAVNSKANFIPLSASAKQVLNKLVKTEN